MNKPLVSIALCTYNGERFLREQLDSLVRQTYPNLEIIAVDDCSTDDTYTILAEYARSFPFIKIQQNESNWGFVKNFEKAILQCKGDFIALSDQDDIWKPDKIKILTESIGESILVYHDSELITETGAAIGRKISDKFNMFCGSDPRKLLLFNCLSGHAMLFSHALVAEILPLKDFYLHDWWIAYVAANCGDVKFVPECLIQFRQHASSQTDFTGAQKRSKSILSLSLWLQCCTSFAKNRYPDFTHQLAALYSRRDVAWIIPKLTSFIFLHRRVLLALQKKTTASKLNYIYKTIWGNKWKQQNYPLIKK